MDYSVAFVSNEIIDEKGIAYSIRFALRETLDKLKINPLDSMILLDGELKAPEEFIFQQTIIKGDEKEPIISLASIAAKVARDRMMVEYSKKFPQYGFEIHKGYGTLVHRQNIEEYGLSELHRKSFCRNILQKICNKDDYLLVYLNMEEVKNTKNSDKIIDEMFKVGAHFGYSKSRRHPTASPYIFGANNRVEIIDLTKTSDLLKNALDFVSVLAKEGKQILFVGGKNEAKDIVKKAAVSIEMPFVAGRWIGGTFTNFSEIKKRVAKLEDLTKQKEKGELSKYTKKERLVIDRTIANLDRFFSGLLTMKEMPKAIFVIDPKKEIIAVTEAKKMGIPVIALASSDCDIKEINYPIIANDSATSSISFFTGEVVSAYKKSKTPSKI